jgi:hypothetical protein
MNTGLRTPGIASPLQKRYIARSNKDSIVFRLKPPRKFFGLWKSAGVAPYLHQRTCEYSWRGVPRTKQRRSLLNAETGAEMTKVQFQNDSMDSFHFRSSSKFHVSCSLQTTLFTILTSSQRTRVYFFPQHCLLCFCVIWVCISPSLSSSFL